MLKPPRLKQQKLAQTEVSNVHKVIRIIAQNFNLLNLLLMNVSDLCKHLSLK